MKNKINYAAILLGLIIGLGSIAYADEITVRASADATAVGGYPTNNFGDLGYTRIMYHDPADWGQEYPLYKFDLSGLPPVIWVNWARMRFYVGLGSYLGLHHWNPPTNFCPVAVFNNLQDWDEMTVTYSNRPACGATPVQTLEHFGLLGVDNVFFTYYDFISSGGWLEYWDGTAGTGVKDLVQAWADGSNNYGVTIKGTTYYVTNNARCFWPHTKEHPTAAVHPSIIINYTELPEPLSFGIIGFIIAMFIARCR